VNSSQQQPERRLDQFGHGAALTGALALEFGHDRIVDIELGLNMGNHTMHGSMAMTGGGQSSQAGSPAA